MIEAFVKRPAMTIVFVLVFVVLGLFSYRNLIIEATPRIDLPIVSVSAPYPGASPVEIESQVIEKIEDAVAEISQIKNITANAYDSFGLIMIEFDIKADVNLKAIEVKDKVEQILNTLPTAAERPIISRFDPLVQPILYMNLSSDTLDARELFQIADRNLKSQLSNITGVASVDIFGGLERQINVRLDRSLMQRYFITLGDVKQAIQSRNINVPGGSLTQGANEVSIRFQGEFQSVDELRNITIVSAEGYPVKLSDVAQVEDGSEEVETISRFNGRESVSMAVQKLSDGDAVSIAERVRDSLPKIQESLPEGAELVVAYDSTIRIVTNTNSTLSNIMAGVLLTVVILFLFLGNFRVTLIAALAIPTSIISTFLLMDFAQFSINMMSLLAIGTALGTLIANAIVIIEAIVAKMEEGLDSVTASIVGTKEVTIAVLAAAGTNLVVFTPIAFMGGIVGQFMKQFGLTVVFATIFSLVASFTLTPMLCALLLNRRSIEHKEHSDDGFLRRFVQHWIVGPVDRTIAFLLKEYGVVFRVLFRYPKTSLIGCLLLLASPALILPYIGKEFFAASDQDMIRISVEMPQGTALNETLVATKKIENFVKEIPEVKTYLSTVGEDGTENASLTVNLKDAEERDRSDLDIINVLIPQMAQIPDAKISLARGGGGGGGGAQGDITIDVYGLEYDKMVELSDKMQEIMKASGNFRSVNSSHKPPKQEVVFLPDEEALQRFGVNNAQIGPLVRTAVTGDDAAVFREKGEEYDINVSLSDQYKQTTEDIGALYINTRGGLLPLSQLGQLDMKEAIPPLQRRSKSRIIQVSGYLSKSTAGQVQDELTAEFAKMEFPAGYTFKFSGQAENMAETGKEIGVAFLMAVILTYMLLVAMLNSFVHPFTIVTAVFTSFVGVFYFLFFMDFSINIGSMMAFVMLVGLAVNNAILLLDQAMVEQRNGHSIIDSLWKASELRFRPIAMTSIAVIAGSFPQIFDTDTVKASMGAVIIGGMAGSMFFTFVLIPLVYWYLERMVQFVSKLTRGEASIFDVNWFWVTHPILHALGRDRNVNKAA